MSAFTWTGSAGDGDHNNAANWLGGAAPTGAGPHTITFDRGNYSMTTNIDAASVTYAISALTITSGFGGNIGSTSAAYVTATGKDITTILCAGRGQYYKIGSGGNVGTSLANRCKITLSSGTQFVMSSGTWQYVVMQGGTLLGEAAAVLSTQINLIGVRGLLQTNATGVTLLEVDGASDVTTYRNVTTGTANGRSVLRALGSAAFTTASAYNSTFNVANTSTATHTTVNLRGGSRLSLANCAASPTVTNLYQWANSAYDTNGDGAGVTLTVTNLYQIGAGVAVIGDQPV